MHHVLTDSLARLQERLSRDERCLGLYLWGSMADGSADTWSDVDAAAVFRDADYAAAKAEFAGLCAELCGPLLVWLPEGEAPGYVNYAFLFEAEERVHLYDFSLVQAEYLQKTRWLRPQRILFDRTGALAAAAGRPPPPAFRPEGLRHQLHLWWVYAYLNGKYFRRGDTYKMLYVQQILFQAHMRVLHAFHPDAQWHWWARDVHGLPAAQQAELLVYFAAPRPEDVTRALALEMDLFSRDARAACARWQVAYPEELERGVRRHLAQLAVTPAA